MVYRRSRDIEKRLEEMLRLIREGSYATPSLAEVLHVSIPTISRCVTALRERGYDIRAEKHADGWRYVIADAKELRKQRHDHPDNRTFHSQGHRQPHRAGQGEPAVRFSGKPTKAAARNSIPNEIKSQNGVSFQ